MLQAIIAKKEAKVEMKRHQKQRMRGENPQSPEAPDLSS
jgi:hypothetical protein